MHKIDLSSIKNKDKKQFQPAVKKTVTKQEQQIKPLPSKHIIPWEDLQKQLKPEKQQKNCLLPDIQQTTLSETQRNKMIALCQLYIAEFPDKLGKYKTKNLQKMSDDELVSIKLILQREASTTNSLNMACEMSCKALELYEYLMCESGINIKGVAKLSQSQEYRDCTKALLLKYLDGNLISQVEPEYKLAYLVISSSLMAHQINSISEDSSKIQSIEQKTINSDDEIVKNLKIKALNSQYNEL